MRAASSGSHLSPFASNFSAKPSQHASSTIRGDRNFHCVHPPLLYSSSSRVSVEYSALGLSTMASTGHDSWQKPQ